MAQLENSRSEAYPVPTFSGISYPERPLQLCITGKYDHIANHNLFPRIIDEYILILCTGGNGRIKLEDGEYQPLHAGELLFIPAGIPHSYGSIPGDYWSILWFHCSGNGVRYFYDCFHAQHQQNCYKKIPITAPVQSHFYFQNILDASKQITSFTDLLYAESLVYQFFCLLISTPCTSVYPDSNETLVQAVKEWIENTEQYHISLDELSKLFGISKYHLIRLFKRYLKTTPMDYFQCIKLNKSCSLLATGTMSIAQISEQLGYSTPYHFSKMFKNHFGISPREFKNMLLTKVTT